ncbi:hypothetical protein ACFQS1_17490 [Paractinoplanes rhizophilus]|uniref:Glycosyltransferase n=1 Tax=Paractinoplanes rhizophilus TaxID=1416877 RepID=A0ABW2HVG6_9ACTN|nr:hypothetical protein [Actinoplanes sp.]
MVGGIGRLEPAERFDRLIRALGEVPGATLLLVGDGPARDALATLATIEGIADRTAGPRYDADHLAGEVARVYERAGRR